MKLFRTIVGTALFCIAFMSVSFTSYAAPKSISDINSRFDILHDRIEARTAEIENRIEMVRSRTNEARDRVCKLIEDRGLTFHSSYCTGSSTPVIKAPEVILSANPTEIEMGGTTTLTWESHHADHCTANGAWSGNQSLVGHTSVSPTTTSTYTLVCSHGNRSATSSVTIHVSEPQIHVPTLTFKANPQSINEGSSTTLTWESKFTEGCTASDGWDGTRGTTGTTTLTPTTTTTYSLTCEGEGGMVTTTVTVNVATTSAELPFITFSANPMQIENGGSSTLTWASERATSCEASGGWGGSQDLSGTKTVSPTSTTSYSLMCMNEEGTTTQTVSLTVRQNDDTGVNHILISEVLYDLSETQGEEKNGVNEWVELYNPTDHAVDLMDYVVGNSSSTGEMLASSTFMLPSHQYVVVTNASTTAEFWDFSSTTVIYLGHSINSGFGNKGDYVGLFDQNGLLVDSVSYGNDTTAFSPSVPLVEEGHSIERSSLLIDTDSANDWMENDSPNPGS